MAGSTIDQKEESPITTLTFYEVVGCAALPDALSSARHSVLGLVIRAQPPYIRASRSSELQDLLLIGDLVLRSHLTPMCGGLEAPWMSVASAGSPVLNRVSRPH